MIRLIILVLHLMVYGVWSSSPSALPAKSRILISTNCTRELFNIKLDLDRSFKGVIFAKDFSDECRVKGKTKAVPQIEHELVFLKRRCIISQVTIRQQWKFAYQHRDVAFDPRRLSMVCTNSRFI